VGASFELLRGLGPEGPLRPCVSVPLVLEYEAVLRRHFGVDDERIAPALDYLCEVGDRRVVRRARLAANPQRNQAGPQQNR